MKFKPQHALPILFCFSISIANAQYILEPVEGFTPQVGIMVSMLETVKDQITESVRELDQSETDYLFDEKANSIGGLIMHLATTEAYYQIETLENRAFTEEEEAFWASNGLGVKGKPIKYYLDLWDQVRQKTLEGLRTKDDEWLASGIDGIDEQINNHWVWFHVLDHQSNHMGQIALVKSRLPK
jgi:uncharacterized damage-inducible protein DinB